MTIDRDFQVTHEDNKSRARDKANNALRTCRQKQIDFVQSHGNEVSSELVSKALDEMASCVHSNVANEMGKVDEELRFQESIRKRMGHAIGSYTCADELKEMKDTKADKSTIWSYNRKKYSVGLMLDRQNSKVHVIKDFISDKECKAIETDAEVSLIEASIPGATGEGRVDGPPTAMVADVRVPWNKESWGNPIATLSRRVLEYAKRATGLPLKEEDDEDLSFTHNTAQGDEKKLYLFESNCMEGCFGQPFHTGERVATVVMYCESAEEGGSAVFHNANIKIKPKKGDAVFFSYTGTNLRMDNGFTSRSSCSVTKGAEKTVTQWIRYKV